MLGRQASQLFQSGKIPLNDAVAQVVANHPELQNEHVNRIVEFANTVTFQEMFQNSEDKNVHFDVADPGVVMRDIKDGGTPAFDGKGLNDYNKLPQQGQDGGVEQAFDSQFMNSGGEKNAGLSNLGEYAHKAGKNAKLMAGVAAGGAAAYAGARGAKRLIDGKQKTASEIREELSTDHEKHANPVDDAFDAYQRLTATREKLAGSYESMNTILNGTRQSFYDEVKSQVLDPDGAGLGGVLSVLEKVAEEDMLKLLMTPVVEKLIQEGVSGETLNESLIKTAGVIVNTEHPLIKMADAIVQVASEMVTCSDAIDTVDQMLEDVGVVFKTAGNAITNGVRDAVGHKGNLPAGIRQRFPRT